MYLDWIRLGSLTSPLHLIYQGKASDHLDQVVQHTLYNVDKQRRSVKLLRQLQKGENATVEGRLVAAPSADWHSREP